MIPTKVHGYIDYLVGLLLIILPFITAIENSTARWILIILGAGTIVYSLITDYELGVARVLSVKAHLIIDILAGIFLAASPWLFDFADEVYLPFVIIGAGEILISLLTDKKPRYTNNAETT